MTGSSEVIHSGKEARTETTDDQRSQRADLIARQGAGARYDSRSAPHDELLLARRGTAYFARMLNNLGDDELRGQSLRSGWTCSHLVAHVSYRARTMAHLLEAARTGTLRADHPLQSDGPLDIERGASLPARALRHLFHHSAVHLDVEWRDLPDSCWDACLIALDGQEITARKTPRLRAIEIWNAGVDIGNGGRRSDIPSEVLDAGSSANQEWTIETKVRRQR